MDLRPTYLEHSTSLLTEDQDYQASNSSLSSKEPFDQHIRKILQRRTSNPVFK